MSRWQRLPVTIRLAPVVLAIGFSVYAVVELVPASMSIRMIDADGRPVTSCKLAFFEYNEAGWGPSPTPAIGEQQYNGLDGIVTLEGELPDEVLVRLTSAELGIQFIVVTRGEQTPALQFGERQQLRGTVVLPDKQPAVDARVLVFGGGSRGVLLAETTTGADGTFTVEGFSTLTEEQSVTEDNVTVSGRSIGIRSLFVRVLMRGHEVYEWDRDVVDTAPLLIEVKPTRPVMGKVTSKHDIATTGIELRSFNLPGLTTQTAADASFLFDHLPGGNIRPSLFLPGLPAGYTHRRCKIAAGDQGIEIEVFRSATVRGRVLNGSSKLPVVGAKVFHKHGPFGVQIVETDSSGEFEISNVPPGEVQLVADILIRRKAGQVKVRGFDLRDQPPHLRLVVVQGSQSVFVTEGVDLDDAVILMY